MSDSFIRCIVGTVKGQSTFVRRRTIITSNFDVCMYDAVR